MSPDLKSLMNRSAPEPSGPVDIAAVGRRSRGLRRRGQLISLTTTLALGLAVFLFFSFAQPNDKPSGEENDRSQVVNPGPQEDESETSLDDRAATFAIKSVAEAGLHDPTDIYFDYLDLDKTSAPVDATDKWVATFSGPECTNSNTKCIVIDGIPPALKLESNGIDFTVTGTEGALSKWSERLTGITAPSDPGPPQFVWEIYQADDETDAKRTHLVGVSYWTGPIPGRYFSECEGRNVDAAPGDEKSVLPLRGISPQSEDERDGLLRISTETPLNQGAIEVTCDPAINTKPEPYEMSPVPEELQLVEVGSEIIVPDGLELAPDLPSKALRDDIPIDIPTGPRYVAARGTFDEGDWGEVEGKDWWFISWGHEKAWCNSFQIGNLDAEISGWGCSEEPPGLSHSDEVIGDSTLNPGGGTVLSFTYGTLSPEVATVEFELTTGDLVRVDAIEAPGQLKGGIKYFAAYLPPAENGYIVARGPTGEELQRERICLRACIVGNEESVNGTIGH
ncbi:MAG TPA: hypothetical protein VEV82_09910 [Actinomycetota bacterium]|nr:hypothetical protein [Actinomycetota bacterium]